jgi:predicted dehydrogenase
VQASVLVVGLGRGEAWAKEIHGTPDIELAGLVDVDAARLARVGDELGVPQEHRFASYEGALGASKANVVVLAVPTPLHKEMSLAGLRAGYHVICEKPMAMTLDEARELREAVKQYDRRFMVGEQYRYADGVENLRLAIADGKIGRLAFVTHEFYRGARLSMGRWAMGDHWSRAYVEASLHDMSVHHFDMWYYITGKRPVEVFARPYDVPWNPSHRKLGYSLFATLEDGIHVDYITGRALARPQTPWYGHLWIVGDEGALYWDGDSFDVTLSRVVPSDDFFGQELKTEKLDYVKRGITNTNLPLAPLLRSLAEAVQEGRRHPCDVEDNWVSFATAMAAVESAQTGRSVEVAKE